MDPKHQKQGLGTRMTRYCNKAADQKGCKTFVPARPSSKKMFEQCGYKVVATHHVDMKKYTNDDYVAKNWLLVREPQPVTASA